VAAGAITFLSDYGYRDEFVGVCHGVIARRAPEARVIDLTHAIAPGDIRRGALVLEAALPYMPAGIHLAVVDPGVGAGGASARRAVALRLAEDERVLVGPDNGLLWPAAQRFGGVREALDIGRSRVRLLPVSRTFHGRDIFAPVAAALAAGEAFATLGDELAPQRLQALELPAARVADGVLAAHVLRSDGFGNVILDGRAEQLAELGARPGDDLSVHHGPAVHQARYALAFAEVPAGSLLLYVDAQRMLALAVNEGSAAELLGLRAGDELQVHGR
jgi:S-adenosylmethionine hydrolase